MFLRNPTKRSRPSTPQDVYAANLRQNVGCPLRSPGPNAGQTEPYLSQGFQIGDVGYVTQYGEFQLLFNIRFANSLVESFDNWPQFEDSIGRRAFDAGKVFVSGVKRRIIVDLGSDGGYRFVATSKRGAILILPDGATLFELEDKYLDDIRTFVARNALQWCKHAQRHSLYLLTAVCKTSSWFLGAFDNGYPGGKIHVDRDENAPYMYEWTSEFGMDTQQGPARNPYRNQTVFIKGFKMTVNHDLLVTKQLEGPQQSRWSTRLLAELRDKLLRGPSVVIRYFPSRDNSEGNITVGNEADDERDHPEINTRLGDHPWLAITHMRLENVDIGHIDAGVCILVEFGTTTKRTGNKPYADIIEWDDEIILPSGGPAHVTLCGTFQLGSTLGTREISEKRTIDTSYVLGNAYNFKFSFGSAESHASLSIILEPRLSYHETHFSLEKNSDFLRETPYGFQGLYSYHRERNNKYLDVTLEYFKCALGECGLDPARRATARFNLATTEFIRCQAIGVYSGLGKAIELYREALDSYDEGHPDRPATLLLLAQALLSRHGRDYDEFTVGEIEQLLAELPPDDSRDRRTADAILATCRFYHTINAARPADVDGLLTNLERGIYTPPYGYFDRPHLLHKLGLAFWLRFLSLGHYDDLEKSIELNAEALQVPEGHDDRTNIAACLGNSLLRALEAHGELTDVDMSIGLTELGQKVITTLDGISYAERASAPSEDLQEQVELTFAMAQLREQIQLMSKVERVWEQGGADDTSQDILERYPLSELAHSTNDSNWDGRTSLDCKRQLGVLFSFLGGEGDKKMRQVEQELNQEWPYKDYKIVATMLALEAHMPYFRTVLARRPRFVAGGSS